MLITTKGGQAQSGPGAYATPGRPEHLRQECVLSLRRLGLDYIDLYQLHQADPAVPFEDQTGVMKELKEEGKIVCAEPFVNYMREFSAMLSELGPARAVTV